MNKILKETEKYLLQLNDKIYLRIDKNGKYVFTKLYQKAFTTSKITDILVLQSTYGGKILTLKETITITENY